MTTPFSESSTFYSRNLDRLRNDASIQTPERERLAAFLTISDYRNLLSDPKVNLAKDFTTDFLSKIFKADLSQVMTSLRDYRGSERRGMQEARNYVEGAEKDLYVVISAKTTDRRVKALISCRGKLDSAYLLLEYLNKLVNSISAGNREEHQPTPPNVPGTPKKKRTREKATSPESVMPARQSFLLQSGNTRIYVYFGGNPPTLVPWELNVDALVIPVGTLGSLSGKMAEGFLDALGQQSQSFRSLLDTESSARGPANSQPPLSRYVEPETPLLLDTKGAYPKIKPRYIIAATAYRRSGSQASVKSQQTADNEDESQDTLEIINAGDAAEAIIRLALERKIASIAIPLLGTGEAGLPSIEVAQDMAATIREAVVGTSIQQVVLLTRDWGAYTSLVSLIQHKPQKSINDLSEGEDKLKVKAEIDALADTLLLAETETPLAVGILGGWGSGKSFAMHILHERMAEIRAMAASDEYVGHPYLIDFDAWTYAKSNLWSSLMQTIFLELNRQIEREKQLAPGRETVHLDLVRRIYPGTRGPTKKVQVGDEILWEQLREYRSQEHEELAKQQALLAQKCAELEKKHNTAIEEVDKAIQQELADAVWQPLWKVLAKPFGKSWRKLFSSKESRDPQAFRNWVEFIAFFLFALVSFLAPILFDQFKQFQYPGILLAVGAFVIGIMRTFDKWKIEVDEIREVIRTSRNERIKAKTEAEKEDFEKIEQEIKEQEAKVSDARRLAGVTATFNSLLELCQARLRQSDYENELGLMHRVKLDLNEIDWALKNALHKPGDNQPLSFPRGRPRIILFIDDLDRCPPQRVVEVLEATQLLLKTELFVIILAMDVRYVTRALEKAYEGILKREGDPSGLDYIEKIIQIPYQVRPVDPQVVNDYVGSMMSVQVDNLQSSSRTGITGNLSAVLGNTTLNATGSVTEPGIPVMPSTIRSPRTLSTLSQVVAFSKEEYEFLVLCCQQINLTPRAIKRLINVYKLLKILWSREPRWPHPQPPVVQAIVLLLTLSCSYPDAMREAFEEMEIEIRLKKIGARQPRKLSKFFETDHSTSANPILVDEWKKLQSDLQDLWLNAKKNKNLNNLKNLSLEKMEGVLPLVYSFSFVSDLGS